MYTIVTIQSLLEKIIRSMEWRFTQAYVIYKLAVYSYSAIIIYIAFFPGLTVIMTACL